MKNFLEIQNLVMLAFAVLTLASATLVAFLRNIVHMAFALLGVFAGVLGLYVLLSADFVAVVQFVIYIGGILVLILFAVMFTTRIGDYKVVKKAMPVAIPLITLHVFGIFTWTVVRRGTFAGSSASTFEPTTARIGNMLLGKYLLPFEIVSLLLILVLVGAVVIARREVK